jgi:hypothetical protein
MNKPLSTIAAAIFMVSAVSLGAGAAKAQAPETERMVPPGLAVPCPNPVHYVITRPTAAGSQQPASLGTYNQLAINQSFKDVFSFKPPHGQCCQFSRGTLKVTYKALQSGDDKHVATSWDDQGGLGPHPLIWGPGPVTAGQIKTVPYTLTPAMLASGSVTLFVQDDTAVVSATLEITGCCLIPNAH